MLLTISFSFSFSSFFFFVLQFSPRSAAAAAVGSATNRYHRGMGSATNTMMCVNLFLFPLTF